MIWRLLMEEYGTKTIYIKGINNVADVDLSYCSMSGIPAKNDPTTFEYFFVMNSTLAERYGMKATDQEKMPQ